MTEATPQQRIPEWDRLAIDGVEVIAREQAMQVTPVSNGKSVPITHVEKVILADEREVHQCKKCGWWDPSAMSVRAHLGKHSPHKRRTSAGARRQTEAAASAGKAAQAARANRHAAIVAAGGPAAYLLQLAERLETEAKALREAARQVAAAQGPEVTEEQLAALREKAVKWDRFVAARDA